MDEKMPDCAICGGPLILLRSLLWEADAVPTLESSIRWAVRCPSCDYQLRPRANREAAIAAAIPHTRRAIAQSPTASTGEAPGGDSERYYDAEIAPRLLALAADAKAHGINLVSMVEYAPGQTGHTTGISGTVAPCFAFLLALEATRCAGNVDRLGLWLYRYAKDTPEHNSVLLRLLVEHDPRYGRKGDAR